MKFDGKTKAANGLVSTESISSMKYLVPSSLTMLRNMFDILWIKVIGVSKSNLHLVVTCLLLDILVIHKVEISLGE